MRVYKAPNLYTDNWEHIEPRDNTEHGAYDVVLKEDVTQLKSIVQVMWAEMEAGLDDGSFDDWDPLDVAVIRSVCEEAEALLGPEQKEKNDPKQKEKNDV